MVTNFPERTLIGMSKLIGYIGDVNVIDNGGTFILEGDPPQIEFIEPSSEDEPQEFRVYRADLDKYKKWWDGEKFYIIDADYDDSWSHAPVDYRPWFWDLSKVARFSGRDEEEMKDLLCSEDPIARAWAYFEIASYYGWVNLDQYPDTIDRSTCLARISTHFSSQEEKKGH